MPEDDRLLSFDEVAALVGLSAATIRSYDRYGLMPVPDSQEGSREFAPGELVKAWPGHREPRDGERVGGKKRWLESTVREWMRSRPGQGNAAGDHGLGPTARMRRAGLL